MTEILKIHGKNPQQRLIKKAAEILRDGLVIYPTDSYYAFGCLQDNTRAIQRIRQLRGLGESHYFTLSCADLSQIGNYGSIDNPSFRLIKSHVPGPYTFILKANKTVAKALHHPSRRTVAFRVLSHPIAQALLSEIGEPIITTTLKLQNDDDPLPYEEIESRLKGKVDCIIDAGECSMEPTTVLDFTENPPRLIREGSGAVDSE